MGRQTRRTAALRADGSGSTRSTGGTEADSTSAEAASLAPAPEPPQPSPQQPATTRSPPKASLDRPPENEVRKKQMLLCLERVMDGARDRERLLQRAERSDQALTAGRRSMANLLIGHQLATSWSGCALPMPLLRPLYPLPHHHRLASACSRACSSRSPARPVHAPAPCCWPKLPISMPDEPAPPRAVSSTPRAIGRARALACLVRASGEESSALARRIAFASPGSY
jgi:hypothetical protein